MDSDEAAARPADDTPDAHPAAQERREKAFWLRAGALAALGLVILAALGSALLSISHRPTPHRIPLAYIGTAGSAQALAAQAGDALDVRRVDSRHAALTDIRRLNVYGALIVDGGRVELLKSSAASPQVAAVLTSLASTAAPQPAALTINEISPLPASDPAGGILATLLQVVVIVGTIGAFGLGRLVPRYRANCVRGELPVLFLIIYAAIVGAGTAAVARAFGVGEQAHFIALALTLAVINLAVTASISALVSLIGSAGTAIGGLLYFLLGSPISGAATAQPLLPTGWRALGQALPPGAGASLLRRILYFPDAPIGTQLLTLALYAAIGALILAIVNVAAGAKRDRSLADLP